jgi:YD repeat-containing protein
VSSCQEGQYCGNPINNATGNKYEEERDYIGGGPFPLKVVRYYNSQSSHAGIFGANWSDSFSGRIQRVSSIEADVVKPDGKTLRFERKDGVWTAGGDVLSRLNEATDADGKTVSWTYATGGDGSETYDASGRLVSIADRAGLAHKLAYDGQGRLASVTGPFGRALQFHFDENSRIDTITDPAGQAYRYQYDAANNLVSVTYPDNKSRGYLYENEDFPHALTGLVDESGIRFATWTYDTQGRAVSSEHVDGAERVDVAYDEGKTSVTDALGRVRSYLYQTLFGSARTAQAEKPSPKGGEGAVVASHWEYDENGNISAYTDYNGSKTSYAYDLSRNLETSRTEADGQPESRTITTEVCV